MSTTEDNKALVIHAIEEVWNKGNLALVDNFYAPDFVFYQEGGGEIRTSENFKQWVTVTHTAFPDIHYTVQAMFAEGNEVATRYTVQGTHNGDFRGLPPTGKQINLTGHIIHRIAAEKKVEGWGYWDNLGLLQQLGLVPPLGSPRS